MSQLLISDKCNKMPMLQSIFNNFIGDAQIALAKFCNIALEIQSLATEHIYATDYDSSPDHEYIKVEYVFEGWNTESFYITINRQILYKIIEVILGGKKINYSLKVQNREFSTIELKIIHDVVDVLTKTLQGAFLIVNHNIKIIKKEIFTKQPMPLLKGDIIFLGRTNIKIQDLNGQFEVVIPYATLAPIKTSLIKSFSNNKLIQQGDWKSHMQFAIDQSVVQVQAELDITQSFKQIEKMKVGDTLITNKSTNAPLFDFKINGIKFGLCTLGQVDGKIAIELV